MPAPASDPGTPPPALDDRRSPWLRLPGAFRAAFDPRSLLLAVVGVLLTRLGLAAAGAALFGRPTGGPFDRRLVIGVIDPADWGFWLRMSAWTVADPWFVLIRPVLDSLRLAPGNAAFALDAFAVLWALLVWGPIGGAIARVAVIRASGAFEGGGVLTALRFVRGRLGALAGAPLAPLVAVAVLSIPGALLGLLYRSQLPGDLRIAGVLAIVPLLLAIPSALLLIGLLACWPLMVLTVAAEGEDGFEAIGRSSSYLARRPGHYALAVAISWAVGAAGLMLVSSFAGFAIKVTAWSLALGGPDLSIGRAFDHRDPIIWTILESNEERLRAAVRRRDLVNDALPTTFGETGSGPALAVRSFWFSHRFWLRGLGLVAYSWAFSFFWSAFARVYLLLRHEVDGTPWADLYRPEEDAEPFAPDPPPPSPEAVPPDPGSP